MTETLDLLALGLSVVLLGLTIWLGCAMARHFDYERERDEWRE